MRNRWIRRLAGGAGLFAAAWLAVADTDAAAQDALPPDLARKAIDADIAMLQKDLPKADKVKMYALKGTAVMIALYGQKNAGGADGEKMAALRDQALKVAAAIGKKDAKGAKAAADALSNPTGGGDKKDVDVIAASGVDIAEAMSPFKKTPRGQNLEADIKAQAKGVTDVAKVGEIAVRSALYGELAAPLKPTDKAKPGSAEERLWDTSVKDMIALSQEIAAEAAKGPKADKAALQARLKKLDAACTACHNEFK